MTVSPITPEALEDPISIKASEPAQGGHAEPPADRCEVGSAKHRHREAGEEPCRLASRDDLGTTGGEHGGEEAISHAEGHLYAEERVEVGSEQVAHGSLTTEETTRRPRREGGNPEPHRLDERTAVPHHLEHISKASEFFAARALLCQARTP